MGKFRVGIDVGGTFTDLVAYDVDTKNVEVRKVPSTPENPVEGMLKVIRVFGRGESIIQVVHGTTLATNAIVERRGAEVCYVTTKGFRDIPFIQRMNRKAHYDLSWIKPKPLAKRRNCREVEERVNYKGEVVRELDEEGLINLVKEIRANGVESVAVCLLFSYANPVHELRIKEILQSELPDVPVSTSYEVCPKWKEYERASTTIADAYIKPLTSRFVGKIEEEFRRKNLTKNVVIMKSNGGFMTLDITKQFPVHTIISGPVGGVVASKVLGSLSGLENIVSYDMGGTSCDVSTIVGGKEHITTSFEIEWGVPIQVPMVDVRSIGAGGGSIAWIDRGGLLRVGPRSAGAVPGPVCYDLGGTQPTVTDANLILGRLNPNYFLGGEMRLHKDKSMRAVQELGEKLGMDLYEVASAIIDITNNNMISALRMVLVEQGYDPADFSLLAFGGAGPLHAAELMREMGIPQAVIPIEPAAFSAFGFLLSDARVDLQRTVQMTSRNYNIDRVRSIFKELEQKCVGELEEEGFVKDVEVFPSLEMRYFGQNYELDVPLSSRDLMAESAEGIFNRFHQLHENSYGFMIKDEIIEIVNFKMTALSKTEKPSLKPLEAKGKPEPVEVRDVFHKGDFTSTQIYRRDDLPAGFRARGPLIIEEKASTTFIQPNQDLRVDRYGNLLIT